jgi:hypothetical protein
MTLSRLVPSVSVLIGWQRAEWRFININFNTINNNSNSNSNSIINKTSVFSPRRFTTELESPSVVTRWFQQHPFTPWMDDPTRLMGGITRLLGTCITRHLHQMDRCLIPS